MNDQSGLDPQSGLPQVFAEYDEDLWLEEKISAPARSGRRLAILFAALFLLLVLVGIGMSVNIAMLIEPEDPLTAPVPIATATAMSPTATLQPTEIPQSSAEENRPQICDAIPNAQGCK